MNAAVRGGTQLGMSQAASRTDIERLAAQVGTPFYLYDADVVARRIALVKEQTSSPGLQARYAMKAC